MNLRIFECLCAKNETILSQCKDLKMNGKIHDFIIRSGFIKIIRKNGDVPERVKHPDDLQEEFKEFFISNVCYLYTCHQYFPFLLSFFLLI